MRTHPIFPIVLYLQTHTRLTYRPVLMYNPVRRFRNLRQGALAHLPIVLSQTIFETFIYEIEVPAF